MKWGGVILILLCCLFLYKNISIPWFGIGYRELMAAFFMAMGLIYKLNEKWKKSKICIGLCPVILIMGSLLYPCSMVTIAWYQVLPYIISALAGTIFLHSVTQKFILNTAVGNVLFYVGENTLTILTWHFLCFKLISLLTITIYGMPMEQLAEFPVINEVAVKGWWVLYAVAGIILPLCLAQFKYTR